MELAFAWTLSFCCSSSAFNGQLYYGRVQAGYSSENMSAPIALFDELSDFGKSTV